VASRPRSALLEAADVALLLPAAKEACAVGAAPTTSTTLTIALGDALAVALMERRAFTLEHFRLFHPGGKLGARLVKVRDLMHTGAQIPLVSEDVSMREALLEMTSKGFGVTGVTDASGGLVGIVTDGDLRRHMDHLLDKTAGAIATRDPLTIGADALASEALAVMNGARAVTSLFVTGSGRAPVGLIHVHDCLRAGVA
jgi:arabinose-5-phosphate isomerase